MTRNDNTSVTMCTKFIDPEAILFGIEQWTQLEEKWGVPIDLDTDEDLPATVRPVFSTLDLTQTTFDSSVLFTKVNRKIGRRLCKYEVSDYKEFLYDLRDSSLPKQLYYVNGHIYSAQSVESICEQIDDIFKSVEKLYFATSTLRRKSIPDVVNCSISIDGLSFDDTPSEQQMTGDKVEKYIDEALDKFEHLSYISIDDDGTRESVTALVKKFSSILSYQGAPVYCSPRRQSQRCARFKELTEFWQSQVIKENDHK